MRVQNSPFTPVVLMAPKDEGAVDMDISSSKIPEETHEADPGVTSGREVSGGDATSSSDPQPVGQNDAADPDHDHDAARRAAEAIDDAAGDVDFLRGSLPGAEELQQWMRERCGRKQQCSRMR